MGFWLNLLGPLPPPPNLGPVIGSFNAFYAIPRHFRAHLDSRPLTGWAPGLPSDPSPPNFSKKPKFILLFFLSLP